MPEVKPTPNSLPQWLTRQKLVHKWSATLDEFNGDFYDPFTQILCVEATKSGATWNEYTDSVTMISADVTCPECKEWMHA